MSRRKIAILGGGMSGLSAAYELTKTEALRAQYDVTIYQMGWRLGGKLASGRDAEGRNLEHGLHVWFGFYENAFRLLQEVYAGRAPPADCPLKTWTDVFKPMSQGGAGVTVNGVWTFVPIEWPMQSGFPGDGTPICLLWDALTHMLGWLKEAVRHALDHLVDPPTHANIDPPDPKLFLTAARSGLDASGEHIGHAETLAQAPEFSLGEAFHAAHLWAQSLAGDHNRLGPAHPEGVAALIAAAAAAVRDQPQIAASSPVGQLIHEAVDIGAAVTRGVVVDLILPDRPLEAIDGKDFRDWLVGHGADPAIAADSALVRLIYDTMFQYRDGDPLRPSYGAGSALGLTLRMSATYKGALMYLAQAGFGEAVVAPLYEALRAAGVKVRFFHKVTALELSDDGSQIARVRLDRQAEILDGDYLPTERIGGLDCWPTEPYWGQLKDGARLRAAGVNFESHWNQPPPAGAECLTRGEDFDVVLMALAPGAYKPFGTDAGLCAQLIATGGPFADYVEAIALAPTFAVQLWSDLSLAGLGWTGGKLATASGLAPLEVWADMSQLLTLEAPSPPGPASLYYLCGTLPTTLYQEPATNAAVPTLALAQARGLTVEWLKDGAPTLWPNTGDADGFNWTVLHDPLDRPGPTRLDAQFIRANVDPTECSAISAAGGTRYRLNPHQTGFSNLILAGEGVRQGFNASAVEAAVMSGMAAARAICGEPASIIGYDFLTRKPSQM